MNISDLFKVDIKDLQRIDYKKLAEELRKRPDVLINIGAVFICLIVFVNLISARHKESSELKAEIKKLEEKIQAIQEYQVAQKELGAFLSNVPKPLPEEELVNTLTDLAAKHNITIESFSPSRTETTDLSEVTTIELMLSLNDYKTMWLFIHDIEQSPYALRFNDWEGYMTGQQYGSERRGWGKSAAAEEPVLKTKLSLSSVKVKNE